ncbi:MAG: EamA family transporter [Candidatus Accumulibacter sp.]|nr:EamA family transporter [Accumulibacter sp.]MBA4092941.1 EamA family transporter [Accumulibacter sp.]
MSVARKSVDGFAAGAMFLLCIIWGLQQVVIKLAAPDIAPIMLLALRSLISGGLVVLLMRRRGEPVLVRDATLWPGLLAGALFGIEFVFLGEALLLTSASHTAVFLYTAPVFTALGLHLLLPSERLRPLQWAGILLAFAGIALAFLGGPAATASADMLFGDALAILGGLAWGATTVVVRTTALSEAPPTRTLLYQLLAGFVVLLAYAVLSGQAGQLRPTPLMWGSLLFNGVVVSFASYLAWFWLLRRYLASRLVVFSFMTPIFGVGFGVLLLDEPLTLNFVFGAVLVLFGVFLVSATQLFGGTPKAPR